MGHHSWDTSLQRSIIVCVLCISQFPGRSLGTSDRRLVHSRGSLQGLIAAYKARHIVVTAELVPDARYVTTKEFVKYGLGNQLPGMVSAFFLALALNRTLLVEAPVMLQHLDMHPLDFSYAHQVQRLQSWGKPEPNAIGLGLERSADFWLLEDWRSSPLLDAHENIYVDYEMDYPLAFMQANVHLGPYMRRYFPQSDVFYQLAAVLFRLVPGVELQVADAQKNSFLRHNIGVQVRRLKGDRECLPDVANYARLALAAQQERGWADEETAFFLATDVPGVYVNLTAALPERKIVYLNKDMTLGQQASANPGTLQDALIDMRLLALCDEIVVTYGSSFGGTAAAWGGLKPYIILFGGSLQLNDRLTNSRPGLFSRTYTSEPCCWQCTRIMHSGNASLIAAWQANKMWLHHSQCHW